MPVFEKNGFSVFFAHIPKTGGESVVAWFRSKGWRVFLTDSIDTRDSRSPFFSFRVPIQHLHAAIYEELLDIERMNITFCLVRNPYSRLVSEFFWQHLHRKSVDVGERSLFYDWVLSQLSQASQQPTFADNHLRPMTDFVTSRMAIHRYEEGLPRVLRRVTKSINQEFKGAPKVGYQLFPLGPSNISVPHENASRKLSGWREPAFYYSDAPQSIITLILDFYEQDFRHFQYPLTPPGQL